MKNKTWSVTSISTLFIIAAIIVVVNLIGLRLFARADLTEQSIYTLSDASKNVVGNLEDRLTVKAYFTKDLPAPYNANSRYVRDLLEDYRAYSGGDFYYEFVDPADEEQLEKEAQQYRVQPAQVNVMERDALQVKKVYMGLVLIYGDKHETIPLIQSVSNLEYEFTTTIKRLVAEKLPKVGFLGNFSTPDLGQDLRTLTTSLAKYYQVVPVNTHSGSSLIAEDIDALVIVQPEEKLDDWTKYCVDQFVMRGGKVAWLVNKIKADASTAQATLNQIDVDDWTRRYGFSIANNIVMDANGAMINIQRQQGFFMISNMVRYAAFPEIANFNKNNPITKNLSSATMFFPSSIDTMNPPEGSLQFEPLFWTSDLSLVQSGTFDISPDAKRAREDFNAGPKPLAYAIQGKFPSYFKGKPVPAPFDSSASAAALNMLTESVDTRMIVFGDGNFVQGQYMQGGGPNLVLILNAIDWLSQDTDLLAIRSRDAAIRPLDPNISDSTKQNVKLANIVGPPILVLLVGLYRWRKRTNRRKEAGL
ncbi:Gldg family protein [bacterium]|nr:Gldg family protein [bacterium]